MRITIAIGPFLPVPPLLGGAVERSMDELSRAFASRGHEVTVISRLYGDLPEAEQADGVRHIRVKGFDRPRSLVRALVLDLIYSLRVLRVLPDADVTIANSFMLPIVIRRRRYGLVCPSVGRVPKGQLRLYRHVGLLLTNSKAIARQMAEQTPAIKDKIAVVPRPLPAEYSALLARGERVETKNAILYVGRIHPEKGIGQLIEAFASLPEDARKGWRLEIVGPWEIAQGGGGEAYLSELRSKAGAVADAVEFAGPIYDKRALFDRYAAAEIFVYPSLAEEGETFGVAAMEAMAIGCCTIVSKLECFEDFIADGKTGLVFDHRCTEPAGALRECLLQAMGDEGLRTRIRTNGLRKGKEFSIDRIIDRLETVFAEEIRKSTG
jgi:glycosyltransferase involved in cell wall biosynthesis